MVAAEVKEDADERKDRIQGAVLFCPEHAAYAVLSEDIVEAGKVAGRGKVNMEAVGERLMLIGSENGVGVLKEGGGDRKERTLGIGAAGSADERFYPDTIDGCKLDKLGNAKVLIVEVLAFKDAVRGEVWGGVVEGIGLED